LSFSEPLQQTVELVSQSVTTHSLTVSQSSLAVITHSFIHS